MLFFTSIRYLIYVLLTAIAFRFCPRGVRPAFLLVASYLFYLTYNPWASLLLAGGTLVAFGAGLLVERQRAQARQGTAVAAISILALVGLIAFYKIAAVLPGPGWSIAAPLGISYYAFKLISYVADVYLERQTATRDLVAFASFAAFFPQMVAGPIQRPGDYLDQLGQSAAPYTLEGILRIAAGLFKKLAVADGFAYAVNAGYGPSPELAWLAYCLFPLQLYTDFSGLTDIAIGSGLLFGIRGPENFNRPFSATSPSDYWRRWHMSLTNWLRDYVFTPLHMAARSWGQAGMILALTLNMVLIGLWHGLSWNFLIFGLLNGAYLVADTLSAPARRKFFKRNPDWNEPANWGGWVLTMACTALALVFFRARTPGEAWGLISRIIPSLASFTAGLATLSQAAWSRTFALALAGYIAVYFCERWQPDQWALAKLPPSPRWVRWSFASATTVVLLFGVMMLLASGGGRRSAFLYEIF